MSRYVLSAEAVLDLENIWEYIATDNPEAADRWTAKLFDAFDSLSRNPGIGHRRQDLTPHAVRFWPVGSYLIIYREEADALQVIAVTQGGRDIPTFLHERLS